MSQRCDIGGRRGGGGGGRKGKEGTRVARHVYEKDWLFINHITPPPRAHSPISVRPRSCCVLVTAPCTTSGSNYNSAALCFFFYVISPLFFVLWSSFSVLCSHCAPAHAASWLLRLARLAIWTTAAVRTALSFVFFLYCLGSFIFVLCCQCAPAHAAFWLLRPSRLAVRTTAAQHFLFLFRFDFVLWYLFSVACPILTCFCSLSFLSLLHRPFPFLNSARTLLSTGKGCHLFLLFCGPDFFRWLILFVFNFLLRITYE